MALVPTVPITDTTSPTIPVLFTGSPITDGSTVYIEYGVDPEPTIDYNG
jgi:hypothetical protein